MALFQNEGGGGAGGPDLESLVPGYRKFLESRSLASSTRRQYLRSVGLFVQFLKARGRRHARDIGLMDLEEFRTLLQIRIRNRPYRGRPTPALVAADAYTRAAASFCRWLVQEGVLLLDPSRDLEPVRLPTHRPVVLTHAQVDELLASVSGEDPGDLRDRAILELFYSAALRFTELLSLEVEDLDLHTREVLIRRGKGGAARRAPLGDWAVDALERYLRHGRPVLLGTAPPLPSDPDALWLSPRGRRMSRWTLEHLVPDRAQKAGLAVRVTAHVLRHAAAVHLLHGGASVRHVQEFLGHRHAQTTVRYTALLLGDLKEAWNRCHPRPGLDEVSHGSDE